MYESFAEVYDLFMEDIPYDAWAEEIAAVLRRYGINEGALVCDLACGTGQMTRRLSVAGYDMIGIDGSVEMLDIARQREFDAGEDGKDILYLCQDMRSFELYGTVAAVISVCDSLNYLLSEEELSKVFSLVANYLDPGGIFVFDLKTPYTFASLLGEKTFAENREEGSYIWENHFDAAAGINEYDLTLFIANDEGSFDRYTETHRQRAYDAEAVTRLLRQNHLEFIDVTDAATGGGVEKETERMVFLARSMK